MPGCVDQKAQIDEVTRWANPAVPFWKDKARETIQDQHSTRSAQEWSCSPLGGSDLTPAAAVTLFGRRFALEAWSVRMRRMV